MQMMMVTGSRGVIRAFTNSGTEIPKVLITSVGRSKRRRKGRATSSSILQSSVSPHDGYNLVPNISEGKYINSLAPVCSTLRVHSTEEYASTPHSTVIAEVLGCLVQQEVPAIVHSKQLFCVDPMANDQLTPRLREETLTTLWHLHSAFYTLSSVVFCKAVCLMDLFITKVKVKPKYAMCVASACYYVASKFEYTQDVLLPTVDSLVMLSRCGGTPADLTRMVEILLSKLTPATVTKIGASRATAADFLETFVRLYETCPTSHPLAETDHQTKPHSLSTFISRQLELALVHTETIRFRPSCIALALLTLYPPSPKFVDGASEVGIDGTPQFRLCDLFTLAHVCRLPWSEVESCRAVLLDALAPASSERTGTGPLCHSPPLVWTLSRRTQRSISTSSPPGLPTIDEEVDEKLSHVELYMAQLTTGLATNPLCRQQPGCENSSLNGR